MKSFKDYITDELIYDSVSQEVEQALYELAVIKSVTASFSKVVKTKPFKTAVMMWKERMKSSKYSKESPEQAAVAVSLQTNKLSPKEFVNHLVSLKLLKV